MSPKRNSAFGTPAAVAILMLATFIQLAVRTGARADGLLPLPNPPDTLSRQTTRPGSSLGGLDDPGASGAFGSHMKDRNTTSASESGYRNNQLRIGESYIGIQTEKEVGVFEPLRRSDCSNDDECPDYAGLPRSEPAKRTMKNLRKPFIGLSISKPLQW